MTLKKNKNNNVPAANAGKQEAEAKSNSNSSLAKTGAWQDGVPESVRTGTKSTVPGTTIHQTNTEINEEGFITVNINNFDIFQATIVNCVDKILQDPKLKDHKFIKIWKAARINQTHPINETSTFRTVSKVFKVSDLKDYRRFLASCPSLDTYIEMNDNTADDMKPEAAKHQHDNEEAKENEDE
jgi:hypothetical protein